MIYLKLVKYEKHEHCHRITVPYYADEVIEKNAKTLGTVAGTGRNNYVR